jgi:hypothetical protein
MLIFGPKISDDLSVLTYGQRTTPQEASSEIYRPTGKGRQARRNASRAIQRNLSLNIVGEYWFSLGLCLLAVTLLASLGE